jgi:hypothetical protein
VLEISYRLAADGPVSYTQYVAERSSKGTESDHHVAVAFLCSRIKVKFSKQHVLPQLDSLGLRLWNSEIPISPAFDAHEFFAGDQAVSQGLRREGMRASSHDVRYHRSMNILETAGFALAPKLLKISSSYKPNMHKY